MSELNGDELKKLIESNARSIEALSASHAEIAEAQRRAEKEMADLRETLADLARFQANALANCNNAVANLNYALADVVKRQGETSAETYRLINRLEGRQGEIVEVIKLLANKVG